MKNNSVGKYKKLSTYVAFMTSHWFHNRHKSHVVRPKDIFEKFKFKKESMKCMYPP